MLMFIQNVFTRLYCTHDKTTTIVPVKLKTNFLFQNNETRGAKKISFLATMELVELNKVFCHNNQKLVSTTTFPNSYHTCSLKGRYYIQ